MCPKIPITSGDDEHKQNPQSGERGEEPAPEETAEPQAPLAADADAPAACAAQQAARAYGASAAPQDASALPDLEIHGGRQEQQLPPGNKADEYLDMLQRLKAEFENFKKRTRREKADTIRFANEEVLRKILPILDNLQRGISMAGEQGMSEDMLKGMSMVARQLEDLIADYGVVPFESLNEPFDPNRHEPMTMVDRDDVEDNTVVQELERGYMMHDKVLRVARVIVSRKPAAADAGQDPGGGGGGE